MVLPFRSRARFRCVLRSVLNVIWLNGCVGCELTCTPVPYGLGAQLGSGNTHAATSNASNSPKIKIVSRLTIWCAHKRTRRVTMTVAAIQKPKRYFVRMAQPIGLFLFYLFVDCWFMRANANWIRQSVDVCVCAFGFSARLYFYNISFWIEWIALYSTVVLWWPVYSISLCWPQLTIHPKNCFKYCTYAPYLSPVRICVMCCVLLSAFPSTYFAC